MILFIILLAILFALGVVAVVTVGTVGSGVLLVFGDLIVFVIIMVWIIKKLIKR